MTRRSVRLMQTFHLSPLRRALGARRYYELRLWWAWQRMRLRAWWR